MTSPDDENPASSDGDVPASIPPSMDASSYLPQDEDELHPASATGDGDVPASIPTSMDASSYLPRNDGQEEESLVVVPSPVVRMPEPAKPHQPEPQHGLGESEQEPRLVKPENVKSKFWTHFMRYDPHHHPDKRTTARCTICGKDISVRQGTGGLKNHLKFKHPQENSVLMETEPDSTTDRDFEEESSHQDQGASSSSLLQSPLDEYAQLRGRVVKRDEMTGTSFRGGSFGNAAATVFAAMMPDRKRQRHDEAQRINNETYADTIMRMDAENRKNEKHWMEMWMAARKEIGELRKELKGEEEGSVAARELERDIWVMNRKKDDYAALLGIPKEELASEDV